MSAALEVQLGFSDSRPDVGHTICSCILSWGDSGPTPTSPRLKNKDQDRARQGTTDAYSLRHASSTSGNAETAKESRPPIWQSAKASAQDDPLDPNVTRNRTGDDPDPDPAVTKTPNAAQPFDRA